MDINPRHMRASPPGQHTCFSVCFPREENLFVLNRWPWHYHVVNTLLVNMEFEIDLQYVVVTRRDTLKCVRILSDLVARERCNNWICVVTFY